MSRDSWEVLVLVVVALFLGFLVALSFYVGAGGGL